MLLKVDDDIVLKVLELDDAESLYALTDGSRHYLREWLPWVDGTFDVEITKSFIEICRNNIHQITDLMQEYGIREKSLAVLGITRLIGQIKKPV